MKEASDPEVANYKKIKLSDIADDELCFENLTPVEINDPKRAMMFELRPGDDSLQVVV